MKFHKYPQEEPEGNLYNKNNFLCKVLYSVIGYRDTRQIIYLEEILTDYKKS